MREIQRDCLRLVETHENGSFICRNMEKMTAVVLQKSVDNR